MKRILEPGGNLFQLIKEWMNNYDGIPIKLSIGQPSGPAPKTVRHAASAAMLSENESMHEYQDNSSLGCPEFTENFVRANLSLAAKKLNLDIKIGSTLPIPGIKPMLGLVIMACRNKPSDRVIILTDTNPGYPTPKVMAGQLGYENCHADLTLNAQNGFTPALQDIHDTFSKITGSEVFVSRLMMMNRPHNPTGQIMTADKWREICGYCMINKIRLFNDGAYTLLDHSGEHCPLALIAPEFPGLSWVEAYSASKLGNMTGLRIGAMVGSRDFIDDIAQIKGDVDSGFCAPQAAGVNALATTNMEYVDQVRAKYAHRLRILDGILNDNGMHQAVESNSGFFTFYHAPSYAFNKKTRNGKEFNQIMIENTGLVGVHFGEYIRYSVSTCNFTIEDNKAITNAFNRARVSY
jgi:aspartate/methionine/tyrosine aminotransferase